MEAGLRGSLLLKCHGQKHRLGSVGRDLWDAPMGKCWRSEMRGAIVDGSHEGALGSPSQETFAITLFHFWLRPEARDTVSAGLELAKLYIIPHSVSLRYLSQPEIKHIL